MTTTKTTTVSLTANAWTSNLYQAEEAAHRLADVVEEHYPVGPVYATRLGDSDVYQVAFKFNVPEDFVPGESEVVKQAMLAGQHVVPMDALQLRANGKRVL